LLFLLLVADSLKRDRPLDMSTGPGSGTPRALELKGEVTMLLSFERPARRRRLKRTSVPRAARDGLSLFADLENYTVANVNWVSG